MAKTQMNAITSFDDLTVNSSSFKGKTIAKNLSMARVSNVRIETKILTP